jgi:ribonucleoside-diphosphate reductase beta chain
MMSVNILEAIRFYVSFACSFAFAERELMEGNAKIIKLNSLQKTSHFTGRSAGWPPESSNEPTFNLCETSHKNSIAA